MSGAPFDPAQVRALATILAETGLTEIEIEGKEGRIRVVRAPAALAPQAIAPQEPGTVAAAPPPAPQAAIAAAASASGDGDLARHPGAILSPMVGIAYLSPEPGSPAFVSVGQAVSAGQTVLLIEAMKTFNQIRAPKSGTVTRILVVPGAPVEYGEPLIILD
jgi:acetyl-CoA carboxylase biotin carboxyl carrier protein